MRREAHLEAAIDILDIVVKEALADGNTVAQVLRYYFSNKRYAGSSDRRNVADIVFAILRHIIILQWAINEAGGEVTGRTLLITELTWAEEDLPQIFGAGRYGPGPISDEERGLMWALPDKTEAPSWALHNCPQWMEPALRKRFGNTFDQELDVLDARAPFIGRVNTIKAKEVDVIRALEKENIICRVSSLTPHCLFLSNSKVTGMDIYLNGDLEIQDQSGQIASFLVDAKPGHKLLDLCAGAGGKTLAIAAIMKNQGEIIATDINPKRIHELEVRAKRAGVDIITAKTISKEANYYREEVLKPLKNNQDRVVLDVPCSGSGTWRRSPELRLRMTPERVEAIQEIQCGLLNEGATCVKIGGRLIYMTCSILPSENEEQVIWFLKEKNKDGEKWKLIPYKTAWQEAGITSESRGSISYIPECLQLTSARHESNGFFVAIFERTA
jgi:16S rRNA (cytosine967-C5)-methyltransferase